jgi:ribosomal protein S18 acetylase RimI-like enzyme
MLKDAKAMLPGGLSLFTFQANKPARAFYEKHGFRAVAFGVSEAEGEPDVTYVWAGDGRT